MKAESIKLENLIQVISDFKQEINGAYNRPLSSKEVCEKYQVSSRTISRKVAAGKLTPITNYGKYLFNEENGRKII